MGEYAAALWHGSRSPMTRFRLALSRWLRRNVVANECVRHAEAGEPQVPADAQVEGRWLCARCILDEAAP